MRNLSGSEVCKENRENPSANPAFLSSPYVSFAVSGNSQINKVQLKVRDALADIEISFWIFFWQIQDSSKSWEINNFPVEKRCVGSEKEHENRQGRETKVAGARLWQRGWEGMWRQKRLQGKH